MKYGMKKVLTYKTCMSKQFDYNVMEFIEGPLCNKKLPATRLTYKYVRTACARISNWKGSKSLSVSSKQPQRAVYQPM